jgi:L-lactate dehydrogenase (cytochrome)
MGADGRKGLRRIVEIIKEEASTTLGLVGLNDINDITSNIVIDSTVNKVNY